MRPGESFKRLSEQSAKFVQLCAFLHYDGISEAIFRNVALNAPTYKPRLPDLGHKLDSMARAKDLDMF